MKRIDARRVPLDDVVDEVCAVVKDEGVVIFPTDTVYGIGCSPSSHKAIERIYGLKGRVREKPLALYFANVETMLEYALRDARVLALARAFLPGPLTLVVPRPAAVDPYLVGDLLTLGLRVPNHDVCNALLARCGPLAATSANLSGEPAYTGTRAIADGTAGATGLPDADLFVDAGPAPIGVVSTVVDLAHDEIRLIRAGALSFDQIVRACA